MGRRWHGMGRRWHGIVRGSDMIREEEGSGMGKGEDDVMVVRELTLSSQ